MNGMTKLHVGVKDGLGVQKCTYCGKVGLEEYTCFEEKVVDKGALFAITMRSQGIL